MPLKGFLANFKPQLLASLANLIVRVMLANEAYRKAAVLRKSVACKGFGLLFCIPSLMVLAICCRSRLIGKG